MLLANIALLVVGIAIILFACELFVNGIEWLGVKLKLGEGAVGSILAAVGTALPETMIPIIAIVFGGGTEASHEIGIGAILGAPFMLSTAAFFVTGFSVLVFSRSNGRTTEMHVNTRILGRDMRFFVGVYLIAALSSFVPSHAIKVGIGIFLIGLYVYYVMLTLKHDEPGGHEGSLNPLKFARNKVEEPGMGIVVVQVLVALSLIIVGARVFVQNMEIVADAAGVSALVMSLIIAPLATELPEKFNSVLWVRESKDTLALGNITGAMVFQSCIPVAVGLFLTSWQLDQYALASVVIALLSTSLVIYEMRLKKHLTAPMLTVGGLFYLAFFLFVIFAPPIAVGAH